MRKPKKEKLKEEIRKLCEEYMSEAEKPELIRLKGFMQGLNAKKKLGNEPSQKD